jgi:cell division protein FtsB
MAMQRDIQVETGPTGKAAVITETVTVVRRLSPEEARATMDQLAQAIAQKEAELADLKDRQDKLAAVADSLAEQAEPGQAEEPQGIN